MWKDRRNHHIMISKQQPKYCDEEWLETISDGKLPTNQKIGG
jgi:hypothetical protein